MRVLIRRTFTLIKEVPRRGTFPLPSCVGITERCHFWGSWTLPDVVSVCVLILAMRNKFLLFTSCLVYVKLLSLKCTKGTNPLSPKHEILLHLHEGQSDRNQGQVTRTHDLHALLSTYCVLGTILYSLVYSTFNLQSKHCELPIIFPVALLGDRVREGEWLYQGHRAGDALPDWALASVLTVTGL